MKKVLFTATVQSHICQFHRYLISELRANGYEVHVAARNNLAEKNGLTLDFADKVFDVPFERSPLSKRNIKAYRILKNIIRTEKYDIIHCNTPMGGILTRLAARKERKKGTKVIYMAHGFHFFKGAPKKNWMVYYPIEKIMSSLCDVLITINKEDYSLATKKMKAGKVEYVPGVGIDTARFKNCEVDKEQKRESIGVPKDKLWVLSIGELLPDKNHDIAIRALSKLPNTYYTIAGNGRKDSELLQLAKDLGMADRFSLLGYRRDIPEFCNSADVFLFPSRFEGLPVSLMEAMSSGMPVVCSRVRGCTDLIDDQKGGFLTGAYDVDEIASAVKRISEMDTTPMKQYNLEKVEGFSIQSVLQKMMSIYSEIGRD